MKCGFCGKELTEGAEFCPECGMILSLGGVSEEPEVKSEAEEELEIPEYTPNVFKAMDFEEEPAQPAMELEASDEEETAVVVEAIPEYVDETEEAEAIEEAEEEMQEEAVAEEQEETFVAPEYDPNAKVSAEFMQQIAEEAEKPAEEAFEEAEAEVEAEEACEEIAEQYEAEQTSYEEPEEEFTPPEYDAGTFVVTLPEEEAEDVEEAFEEPSAEAVEEAYPVYNAEPEEGVPEEKLTEDESLFAALFEDEEGEKIEDITPVDTKPEKTSKKNFASIAVLLIVLVGVVIAGGYVFKNVLPKIVDTSSTTTAATEEKVDGTVKPEDKTTTEGDKTTTEKDEPEKTTEPATDEPTTEEPSTEEPTTEEPTTTKVPEKTTEPTTESAEPVVIEPSSYNVDEVPFFPISGDINIKAGPSASSADMIMHPYGYPVYAYAKEGSYYYVDSPILDFMGWVSEKDIEEYVEESVEDTTASAPEAEEAPAGDSDASYTAVISSAEGLNFRTGPGSDYEVKYTVPGGYHVRVSKESTENPGWVYVTIEDDRYPYGSPSGWVSSEFLS